MSWSSLAVSSCLSRSTADAPSMSCGTEPPDWRRSPTLVVGGDWKSERNERLRSLPTPSLRNDGEAPPEDGNRRAVVKVRAGVLARPPASPPGPGMGDTAATPADENDDGPVGVP